MVSEPEDRARKTLVYSILDGIGYSVMVGAGETYFIPYAIFLGGSNLVLGLFVALPILVGSLSQIFSERLLLLLGTRKRVICAAVRYLLDRAHEFRRRIHHIVIGDMQDAAGVTRVARVRLVLSALQHCDLESKLRGTVGGDQSRKPASDNNQIERLRDCHKGSPISVVLPVTGEQRRMPPGEGPRHERPPEVMAVALKQHATLAIRTCRVKTRDDRSVTVHDLDPLVHLEPTVGEDDA